MDIKGPKFDVRCAFEVNTKREFNLLCYPIFYAYLNSLSGLLHNENIDSITIIFNDSGEDNFFGSKKIIGVNKSMDFSQFWNLSDESKRLFLLNSFKNIFTYLSNEYNLELSQDELEKGIFDTIENNYHWKNDLTIIKESPRKKRKIKISFEYDFIAQLAVVFLEQISPEQTRIKLLCCKAIWYYLDKVVGKLTWLNDDELILVPQEKFPTLNYSSLYIKNV
ncbi:MAG: hypothetical protein AAF960_29195 [Bacteroidota bacterium]